jgi:hypothetical protein
VSVTIQVPESGPLFEGHFPGRPILPGVALLAMICHAIAPGATLRGIRFVRFRELVLPGQVVDVVATSGADGATRFETRRDGAKVANGSVVFGDPTAEADEGFSVAARPVRDVPPLDELLPHRKPMRVVEAVLGEADDGATCLARISDRCGLSAGGEAPALASIEAAAQTAAVWEALRRRREGATTWCCAVDLSLSTPSRWPPCALRLPHRRSRSTTSKSSPKGRSRCAGRSAPGSETSRQAGQISRNTNHWFGARRTARSMLEAASPIAVVTSSVRRPVEGTSMAGENTTR